MSDFRMDDSRPINNNSGSMKYRDSQITLDRTKKSKPKTILDTDEDAAKNRENKESSDESNKTLTVSTGQTPDKHKADK